MRCFSFLLLIFLLLPESASAQLPTGDVEPEPFDIEGRWTGAYTRGDATQSVSAMVEIVDDTARITLRNDEWGYGNVRQSPIRPADGERLTFDSHYGTATVDVDSTFREMIGTVGDSEPRLTIHLKQAPPPPPHEPGTVEEVTFESEGATLGATIVVPAGDGPHLGVVSVSGRGCNTRGGGVAHVIIRTTRVDIVPLAKVSASHAAAEGEGDGSLDDWHRIHRPFYRREAETRPYEVHDGMLVVCERFEVVFSRRDF